MMEPLSDVWEASLFGLMRVRCGDQSVDHFQTRQTALLFAYLIIYPRRHSRDEIIDLLWPEADPESGRRRLSQAIWRIRQILHELCPDSGREIVIADRSAVAIDPDLITSDVARFRQSLQRAAKLDNAARIEAQAQAVAAYGDSGVFLSGFYEDWVLSARQRLLTDYLTALKALASHYEKVGEWQRSLELAERAVAADPLREDSHADLIRLLMAGGQVAAAQRHFSTLTRLLARELNAEPTAATRALITSEPQLTDSAPESPLPVVPPLPPTPVSLLQIAPLPVPLTTFYGREVILRDMEAMLNEPTMRLITLLGTGGMGKTRLALELVRGVATRSQYPSVAFVPLADIVEPRLIGEAIADALTPRREATPLQRVMDALTIAPTEPPFLLVLDNAEHLAEQVGEVAAELLARVPRLRVLVTSQRSLGISGERELTLTALELTSLGVAVEDSEDAPSVRLFLDRAKSVRPGFPTDAASLANVARICERLEGLPLAIELCAGWAQTLGTQQMLEILARRFELLVSRRTDIPARHRTLRAAIEYSYMQLSESLQEFFVRLSIFRDGWTLTAVAAVCTDGSVPVALAMLAQLRERSLLVADEVQAGDGMRYKMLESLRDFAIEQQTMAQQHSAAAAHAAYFGHFMEETVARLQGQDDALWATRLEDEIANIRAALEFLTSRRAREDIEPIWTVTAAIAKAWNGHAHAREARQWITRALAMEAANPPHADNYEERSERLRRLRARLLMTLAESLRLLSDFASAAAQAEQALAIWQDLNDNGGMTECLELIGITALFNDDYDRAQTLLAQALVFARTRDEPYRIAQVLSGLGGVAVALQDWQTGHALITECLEIGRRLDNNRSVCSYLNNLSLVARYQGNYAEARELLREAIQLRDRYGLTNYSAFDLNLAVVERLDGCCGESLRLLSVATRNTLTNGERRVLAWCIKEMGHLAIALRQHALGLRLLSCAETMRVAIGMSFKPMGPQDIAHDQAIGEQALGREEASAAWIAGLSTDPEMLLAQAQTELGDRINLEK